jgi:hypothetical protein
LASAAPRSPYRHLELCGIAFTFAPRQDILKSRTIRAARSPAKYKDVLS